MPVCLIFDRVMVRVHRNASTTPVHAAASALIVGNPALLYPRFVQRVEQAHGEHLQLVLLSLLPLPRVRSGRRLAGMIHPAAAMAAIKFVWSPL